MSTQNQQQQLKTTHLVKEQVCHIKIKSLFKTRSSANVPKADPELFMRTICAEQGPCSKQHASSLWNALSSACRCFPPLFRRSLAPHPLPSACHRDSGEWIHSKGSQRSLLLNWTLHELGPTAGSMHQKYKPFLLAALLCVSWRLPGSTPAASSRISRSICLCLLLKISSNRDSESSVLQRRWVLFCHPTKWMKKQWCGYVGEGNLEFLDGISLK